jgi:hypothetical protein
MSPVLKMFLLLACLLLSMIVEVQVPMMSPMLPSGAISAEPIVEGAGTGGAVLATNGMDVVKDVGRPRDPFWPVGYVPVKLVKKGGLAKPNTKEAGPGASATVVGSVPEPAVRMPMWDDARKRLDIRGISLIRDKDSGVPRYLAMVAGKLVEVGNVVVVKFDERVYRWRVVGINEDGVSLQKLDVRGD